MGSSEGKPAKRETMTTGQAAKRLGISKASVARRVDAGVLEGFRRPGVVAKDINGHALRGYRFVYVDSIEAYERFVRGEVESGRPAEFGPDSNSAQQDS